MEIRCSRNYQKENPDNIGHVERTLVRKSTKHSEIIINSVAGLVEIAYYIHIPGNFLTVVRHCEIKFFKITHLE